MTRVKDYGPSIMRHFWSLLVLVCIYPTIQAASPPPPPTSPPTTAPSPSPPTFKQLKDKITTGNAQLHCHVCTSLNGPCSGKYDKDSAAAKGIPCNDVGKDGYLQTVYGSGSVEDATLLEEWPPSLTWLAKNKPASTPGWAYSVFKDGYPPYIRSAGKDESFKVSSFVDKNFFSKLQKGFRSCRIMKVWVEEQNNKGRTTNIPLSNPRIVRSCSFMDFSAIKGKDGFDDEGCRTLSLKTSTVQVCYCQPDKDLPCNGVPYLRASQYWILLAFVLVVGVRIGQTVYE